MKCPKCQRQIVDEDELEFVATFGECLACDHVQLDADEELCGDYSLSDEQDYYYGSLL